MASDVHAGRQRRLAAGALRAGTRAAATRRTGALVAAAFFTGALRAATFVAAAFFTGALVAATFFTAVFVAATFFTGAFFTAVFVAAAFFAGALVTAAFFTGAFFAAVFVAAAFLVPAAEAGRAPPDTTTLGAPSGVRPFMTSLNVELAAKLTPLLAGMRTAAPVCGLRPMRAARRVGRKAPKPTTATRRPAFTSLTTVCTNALTAFSASRLANDVVLLIASTSSDLFTATS